jgi:hypothetical protein
MYSIISNENGLLDRYNHENEAFFNAIFMAQARGESLYIYFRNKYLGEVAPTGFISKEVETV